MLIRPGDIVQFKNGMKGRVTYRDGQNITVVINGKRYVGPAGQVQRNLTVEKYGTEDEEKFDYKATGNLYHPGTGRGIK